MITSPLVGLALDWHARLCQNVSHRSKYHPSPSFGLDERRILQQGIHRAIHTCSIQSWCLDRRRGISSQRTTDRTLVHAKRSLMQRSTVLDDPLLTPHRVGLRLSILLHTIDASSSLKIVRCMYLCHAAPFGGRDACGGAATALPSAMRSIRFATQMTGELHFLTSPAILVKVGLSVYDIVVVE